MPRVMITCPTTGKPVPTGIAASKESYASMQASNNATQCPHCGQMHTWSKADTYLEGERPGPQMGPR